MKKNIEMAREASNTPIDHHATPDLFGINQIERFAELVRADERERFRIDDLEMLLQVRAEQIVALQDEIRNLTGEE